MGRDLPPWPALEAFIAAAQCGSFKAAAEYLNLSAPALTRRIQTLKHHLGARLFDRNAKRALLTGAGRHHFDRLRPGFESLRSAMLAMRPDGHGRPVRLRISHSDAWRLLRRHDTTCLAAEGGGRAVALDCARRSLPRR